MSAKVQTQLRLLNETSQMDLYFLHFVNMCFLLTLYMLKVICQQKVIDPVKIAQ